MKKQNCRMTPQEKETHKKAGKLRRMTDAQLVEAMEELERRAAEAEKEAFALKTSISGMQDAVEKVRNAAVANESAAICRPDESGEEFTAENAQAAENEIRGIVRRLIDHLAERVGSGAGIGPGTILKIRKIADYASTSELEQIFYGE